MDLLGLSLGASTNLTRSFYESHLEPPRTSWRAMRTMKAVMHQNPSQIKPNPSKIQPNPTQIQIQPKSNRIQIKSKSSQIKIEIKSRSKSNKLLGDQKSYESNPRKSDFRSFFSARGWPLSLATGHWAWPLPWPLSHWGGHSRSRGKARAERWPRNEVLRFIAFLDLNLDFLGFPILVS